MVSDNWLQHYTALKGTYTYKLLNKRSDNKLVLSNRLSLGLVGSSGTGFRICGGTVWSQIEYGESNVNFYITFVGSYENPGIIIF